MKKLRDDVENRKNELKEIEEMRRKFFGTERGGKIKADFLDPICEDVIRRMYSEKLVNENLVRSHKTQPHKLMLVILRDLDFTVMSLLEGSVSLRGAAGQNDEVLLFKPGLFRSVFDEMNVLHREIDVFLKKNPGLTYDFREFMEDTAKPAPENNIVPFLQIVKKFNLVARHLVHDLGIILDNHNAAIARERSGNSSDKLVRTRSVPIEDATSGARYFPFAEQEVYTSNRMNGKKVITVIEEIVKNLYNYLYIYRDQELLKTLAGEQKIQMEIEKIKEKLRQMGDPSVN
jgi:hypothetical protein